MNDDRAIQIENLEAQAQELTAEQADQAQGGAIQLTRSAYYADPANLVDLRSRLLVGCGVTVAWPRGRVRMTASAANLTGTRREDVDGWALPGRTVFLALAYAPIGAGDEAGAAIFDPRYGQ